MKRVIIPVVAFVAMVAAMLLNACTEPLTDTATPEVAQTDADAPAPIEFSPEELSLVEQIANNSPKISQESAQQTAMQLLGLQGDASEVNSTPAKPLLASTVFCNRKTVYNGISKSYETENDTAFYVFNTPDDNGFAIVAADLRVPNQVLAFSDHGSFALESDNQEAAYILELAQDYVANCIAKAEAEEDSIYQSICNKLGINLDTIRQGANLSKSQILYKIKCTTVGTPKVTIKDYGEVKPMLTTKWGQWAPYNGLLEGRPARCGTVAIAQLLAFWKAPKNKNFDWNLILDDNLSWTSGYKNQVAKLFKYVADGIKDLPNKDLNKNDIPPFLRKINMSTQKKWANYSFSSVVEALDNKIPVIFSGYKKNNDVGHIWIAHGYLKREYTREEVFKYCIVEQFDDGTITQRYEDIPSKTTKNYDLLYINWGWEGIDNGYFDQNVFDVNRRYVEQYDGSFSIANSENGGCEYYNSYIKTITDIYPR